VRRGRLGEGGMGEGLEQRGCVTVRMVGWEGSN
jgi:hypothetical protein